MYVLIFQANLSCVLKRIKSLYSAHGWHSMSSSPSSVSSIMYSRNARFVSSRRNAWIDFVIVILIIIIRINEWSAVDIGCHHWGRVTSAGMMMVMVFRSSIHGTRLLVKTMSWACNNNLMIMHIINYKIFFLPVFHVNEEENIEINVSECQ